MPTTVGDGQLQMDVLCPEAVDQHGILTLPVADPEVIPVSPDNVVGNVRIVPVDATITVHALEFSCLRGLPAETYADRVQIASDNSAALSTTEFVSAEYASAGHLQPQSAGVHSAPQRLPSGAPAGSQAL